MVNVVEVDILKRRIALEEFEFRLYIHLVSCFTFDGSHFIFITLRDIFMSAMAIEKQKTLLKDIEP